MAKPYNQYQYLDGTTMTDRDKQEVYSKFWNKGKWDNFVAPFLSDDVKEMTLVDIGCNAGLFLKFAEGRGFKTVIGVDGDEEAVERGCKWRDQNGSKYGIFNMNIREGDKIIEKLPVADYTIFVNSHYYFTVNEWLDYLDKLQYKTRYCIIVTSVKRHLNRCWASADVNDIRSFFKTWQEVGFIDKLSMEGDPSPRELYGLCFKSPFVDIESIKNLDSSNHVQDKFCEELDKGFDYKKTRYYRILKGYRKRWSEEKLNQWIKERIATYDDIKKNGLRKPIIVDSQNKILDGNHRYAIIRHLGYKNIYIRRV